MAGRRRAAPRSPRAGAARPRSGRSAGAPRGPAARRARPSRIGERERPGPGAVLAEHERLRPAEPVPGVRDGPGERGAEDRVRLRGGQEVAVATRARRLGPVVAAVRVVQREVHEPGERDRAVARDLVVDPRHETVVLPDRVEVRDGIAPEARRHLHGARPGVAADDQPHPRPDERVATEQDRDRRRRGRRRQLAEPRIGDPLGEQQVGGEAVLGGGPAGLVGADPVGEQDPACRRSPRRRSRARWSPSDPGPSRSRSAPEDRAGRPVGRASRSPRLRQARRRTQAALLDPAPGSARPCAARARPASPTTSGRRRAARRADRRRRRGRAPSARSEQRQVGAASLPPRRPPTRTRSSGPSMSIASRQRRRRSSTW